MKRKNRKKLLDNKLSREKEQAKQERLNKAFRNILVQKGVMK